MGGGFMIRGEGMWLCPAEKGPGAYNEVACLVAGGGRSQTLGDYRYPPFCRKQVGQAELGGKLQGDGACEAPGGKHTLLLRVLGAGGCEGAEPATGEGPTAGVGCDSYCPISTCSQSPSHTQLPPRHSRRKVKKEGAMHADS
ncbi:unnamed protein product [Caretta caretta]